jgi:D-alanyl-D-alanine carboxypeptidase
MRSAGKRHAFWTRRLMANVRKIFGGPSTLRSRPAGSFRSLVIALAMSVLGMSVLGLSVLGVPGIGGEAFGAAKAPKPTKPSTTKPPTTKKGSSTTVPKGSGKGSGAKTTAKKPAAKITLGVVRQTQSERDRVRAKRATQAKKIDTAKATKDEAARALEALNSKVRLTNDALSTAEQKAKQAKKELAQTEDRLAKLEAKLTNFESLQLEGALDAFATPATQTLDGFLLSEDSSEVGRRQVLSDLAKRSQAGVIDELGAVREDLAIEKTKAAKAKKKAIAIEKSVASKLAAFKEAQADQQTLADDLEARLEADLEESAALAEIDKTLSSKLAKQNEALARQLAASAGAGGRGGGKFQIAGKVGSVVVGSGGDTHGIVVAASIRSDVIRMLAAAQADGVYLTGGGYRSASSQIALRAAHCGGSTFAIWHMRSSQCRPPTARPGFSQHERGLAIDFSEGGHAITRGSRAYNWLRANAGKYGFKNLPSESWHWSTTGR